jgi:hypothetical protein
MKRREFLRRSAVFGGITTLPFSLPRSVFGLSGSEAAKAASESARTINPLTPPAHGSIPVAFVISKETVIIDFTGPWEVFEVANYAVSTLNGTKDDAFQLYTVAETKKPLRASGITVTPEYAFDTAPSPKIIVIPQQEGATERMLDWIRKSSKQADVTMSICTGPIHWRRRACSRAGLPPRITMPTVKLLSVTQTFTSSVVPAG